MKFFLLSSYVYLRVIRSSSLTEYSWAEILTPPLAPPNGTLTMAHL